LACQEALALARDINNHRIMIASGSSVIRSIEEGSRGVYAHIVQEIVDSKNEVEQVAFRHEQRTHNKKAHNLARSVVLDGFGRQVWLIEPPQGLCIPVTIDQ
jgi:hypothetical protein